jgi:hypothetical protein
MTTAWEKRMSTEPYHSKRLLAGGKNADVFRELGFEGFGKFEELGDRVPVAAGKGKVEDFFEAGPGKIRPRLAVGEINVEFVALDVEFFGSNVHGKELFARWCAGFGGEESHDEPARI